MLLIRGQPAYLSSLVLEGQENVLSFLQISRVLDNCIWAKVMLIH